jgi:DNA-directed RNA polymerase sigma subunit (sigma70/sigma32)
MQWMDQYKILTPRRKEMLVMRSQGKTLKAIGLKFGISRERVRQILKKLDNFKT